MKNKKAFIILGLTVFILIIIFIIVMSALLDSKENNNKIVNNYQNQYNIQNETNENVNNNSIQSNEIINNTTQNTVTDTPVIVKSANELYKENLLNKDWVKENLYIKTDCFGNKINEDETQKAKYIKMYDETFSNPVVLIYTECESKNSNQCYVLTYNNGEILVNSINEKPTHNSHVIYKVNGRNKILYKGTTYSDYEEYEIYNITDTGLEKIYSIKKQYKKVNSNTVIEYYSNETKINENQYTSIKNQYVQESARGEEFRILSSDNLNNSFQN